MEKLADAMMVDEEGRRIRYLRMSLTDRCELRCLYCMPGDEIETFRVHLSMEEIRRLVTLCVDLGIEKVRLTGGEPLSRAGVPELIERLVGDERMQDLTLTTNGTRLVRLAASLQGAGLRRINVSVDSLDPVEFARIRKGASLPDVLAGIDRALECGLTVKMNVVLLKGVTEKEASRFARFAIDRGLEVRFIEYMPLNGSAWEAERFLPASIVQERIAAEFPLSTEEEPGETDRVARVYRIDGTAGRIGFISTFSQPFCGTCSRLRITSRGGVRLCLFSPLEISLLPLLRKGGSDEEIKNLIRRLVARKPKGHGISMAGLRTHPADEAALIRTVGG